jgi:hypothetical protein
MIFALPHSSLASRSPQSRQKSICIGPEISSALRASLDEKPGVDRYNNVSNLAIRLSNLGVNCISDTDMFTISRFLRNEDDSMRLFAAMIISNIGPNARDMIPALKAALAERPCEDKDVTSAAAIRIALKKLGEMPPAAVC